MSQQADELRACAASVRHKVLMGVAHTAEELGSTCAGAALSHSLHLASAHGYAIHEALAYDADAATKCGVRGLCVGLVRATQAKRPHTKQTLMPGS